jgi:Cu+-exporting ATPase
VAEAQRSRAPIQGLADKVSALFVPAVLGIAVLTFVLWLLLGPESKLAQAVISAVAVLIIASPCALGLATPMSIMVGVGRAARLGVLIRNAESIEALQKVTDVVVDKTGTLTEGKPRLLEVLPVEGWDRARLLALAAAVEKASEHPLAAAIVQGARDTVPNLSKAANFESVPGGGVLGDVEGRRVCVGQPRFLRRQEVNGVDELVERAKPLQEKGQTIVLVAIDGRAAGILSIVDPIRESTPEAIRTLHSMGLKIHMRLPSCTTAWAFRLPPVCSIRRSVGC